MKRRQFMVGVVAGVVFGSPALAQDYVESIIRQLKRQGFRSVVQERTLLGRVRITASRKDGRREIIVNPKSGEILRDLWTPISGGSREVSIIDDDRGGGSGGGDDEDGGGDDDGENGGDDDGGDDGEGGDDSEDDGESGGSSSGGSGGSGSGGGDDDGDDGDDDDGDDD